MSRGFASDDSPSATIGIDLRLLNASGIGTYLRHLVPPIVSANPSAHFDLLGEPDEMRRIWPDGTPGVSLHPCRAPIYSIAEQLELGRRISARCDLFWAPHYNVPLVARGRLVATVHDAFHLAMPQYVPGVHRRLYARAMFAALNRRASAILCVSAFTADELVRLTGTDPRKIRVIHLGVGPEWFAPPGDGPAGGKPYLLFVGNVKPHKNLPRLVEAFGTIRDEVPHDLVIVGRREGFLTGDATVARHARELGERVRFTGYVDDDRLRRYVAGADALVLPSLYEGFGLPPLEAMASGCPVVVSRAGSLPEVCGDAALYCDPYSVPSIAEAIRRVLGDRELRAELRGRGRERARRFTWSRAAEQTAAVIEDVLRR